MDRLTKTQAAALNERIGPMMNYLYRCRERLSKRGFLLTSPLYKAVDAAYDALHSLRVMLHYDSIGHGVGEPPSDE
jgi:hypothetical protein